MGTDKTDPLKQNQIPSLPLIRAGREIRGQNSSIQEFLTTNHTDIHG